MIKHTKGPYAWYINTKTNYWHLSTTHSGQIFVLGVEQCEPTGTLPEPSKPMNNVNYEDSYE